MQWCFLVGYPVSWIPSLSINSTALSGAPMLRVASLATIRSRPFGDHFAAGVVQQVLGLGGKADAHQALGAGQIAQAGQDVGVAHHVQGEASPRRALS